MVFVLKSEQDGGDSMNQVRRNVPKPGEFREISPEKEEEIREWARTLGHGRNAPHPAGLFGSRHPGDFRDWCGATLKALLFVIAVGIAGPLFLRILEPPVAFLERHNLPLLELIGLWLVSVWLSYRSAGKGAALLAAVAVPIFMALGISLTGLIYDVTR
jgi:hypothetical protein